MIRAGASSTKINGELGRPIQGASVDNTADTVRDDLEANALAITTEGTSILLVSCDLAGILPDRTELATTAMAEAIGFDRRDIIIATTHTHSGPSVIPTNPAKPLDEEYLAKLTDRLVRLAKDAAQRLRPARVGWGSGRVKIGYNRRLCWADGSHTMGGDPRESGYIGIEGPDDDQHVALLVLGEDGMPMALLHCNTGHPTSFYGENFYSADYPGAARTYLREVLGSDLPVLYMNGAFGDIERQNHLTRFHLPESRERNMRRMAHLTAGETLRCLHEMSFSADLPIAHRYKDMPAEVRLPSPERLAWAREVMVRFRAGEGIERWDRMLAYGITSLHDQFADNPRDILPIHAIRIGDLALVTQPCELYCQFGLDIKRRSPAAITAIGGIADGYRGYLPTTAGAIGGGYSGEPIFWTRLATETGYRLVDTSAALLHELWAK